MASQNRQTRQYVYAAEESTDAIGTDHEIRHQRHATVYDAVAGLYYIGALPLALNVAHH